VVWTKNASESNHHTNRSNIGNISDLDKTYFYKLKNYLSEFGKQMLLVIDNIDEANSLNDMNILFPNDPTANYNVLALGCNILFTTRKKFDLSAEGGNITSHQCTVSLFIL
jgi:hypothetical protein